MALTEKLEMLISMDASQAVSELNRFSKDADKNLSAAQSSVQKYHDAGIKLLSIGGAGLAAGGFLNELASHDVAASNSLRAAVTQVGQSYDEFKGKLESAAAAQAKFGHTDDDATKALTTLTLAYNDTGKALNQMQLVADLAAKKNIDLAAAAEIVARAHGGAGKIFKEFGITVGQNAQGAKDYDGALSQLAQKLTGQAAASVDSWLGRLQVLRAEVENHVSAFAQDYGPAIQTTAAAMTALGGITTGVTAIIQKVQTAHAAAAAAAAAQAVAETELGVASEGAALALGPAGLAIAAAAAVVAFGALLTAQDSNSRATEDYTAAIRKQTGALNDNVDAISASQLSSNESTKAAHAAGLSYESMFQAIRSGKDDFGAYRLAAERSAAGNFDLSATLKMAGADTNEFGRNLLALVSTHKLTATQVLDAITVIERLHNGYTDAAGASRELAAATSSLGDSSVTTAAALATQKQAIDELNTKLDTAKQRYEDVVTASHGLLPAGQRVQAGALDIADAQQRVLDAEQKLKDARAGTPADMQKITDAQIAGAKALEDYNAAVAAGDPTKAADAENRHAKALAAIAAARGKGADQQKVAQAERDLARAQLGVTSAVDNQANALVELKVTQDAANGVANTAADKVRIYEQSLIDINSTLTGPAHEAVAGYIADLEKTKGKLQEIIDKAAEVAKIDWTGTFQGMVGTAHDLGLYALGSREGQFGGPLPASQVTPGFDPGAIGQLPPGYTDPFAGLTYPTYDLGGMVPGYGPRLAIVHGGEKILTPQQQQAAGATWTVNQTIVTPDPWASADAAQRGIRRVALLRR